MCIKQIKEVNSKEEILNQILADTTDIISILEIMKTRERLYQYELVRLSGKYNMFDEKARLLVGLNKDDYTNLMKNYSELMIKYPDIKTRAEKDLEYIKSANIAKVIAIKGCKNCIEIVSNKLDVKEDDLCEECKKILINQKLL